MQQKTHRTPGFNSTLDKAENVAVDIIDEVTKFPGRIDKFADRLNDGLIDLVKDVQRRGGAKMEKNLTEQKVRSWGGRAAEWIKNNPYLSVGGVILLFILIRR